MENLNFIKVIYFLVFRNNDKLLNRRIENGHYISKISRFIYYIILVYSTFLNYLHIKIVKKIDKQQQSTKQEKLSKK